jgi:amino acid transporter
VLGTVHPTRRTPWVSILFTTAIAFALITYVVKRTGSAEGADAIALLGGTTALLLLCVFTVVNVALLVLRRQPVDHEHFRAPVVLPVLGAITCAFLAGPWARNEAQREQYEIAGYLMVVGAVLWLITWLINRGTGGSHFDPEIVDENLGTTGPVN